MNKRIYLCMHAIQVVPASCINRDDTGTPKFMYYGGTRRSRVSPSSWNHAIRMYSKEMFGDTSIRTKHIVGILAGMLAEKTDCSDEKAKKYVKDVLSKATIISKKEDAKDTSAFFSEEQIGAMFEIILNGYTNNHTPESMREALQTAVCENPAESQLIHGRMFASNQSLNYDAARQVADAFTVHAVEDESDYFTVVGDVKLDKTNAGSDFLDSRLFNTGVYYRYGLLNLSEGSELRDPKYNVDTAAAAGRFLEEFIMSFPSGGSNTHANMTLPEMAIVELRTDNKSNYAPAFLNAIDSTTIAEDAIDRLTKYDEKSIRIYNTVLNRWVLGEISFRELRDQVVDEINRRI